MRAAWSTSALALLGACHLVSGLTDFELEGQGGAGGEGGDGGMAMGGAPEGGGGTGGDGGLGGGGMGGIPLGEPGDPLWLVGFRGAGSDRGRAITATDDDAVLFADFQNTLGGDGVNATSDGARDLAVIALGETDGATSFATDFGGPNTDIAQDVIVGPDGSIYTCGSFRDGFTFAGQSTGGASGSAGFVAKHSPSGAEEWLVRMAGSDEAACHGIGLDSGAIYAAGFFVDALDWEGTNLTSSGQAGFVVRIGLDGTPQMAVALHSPSLVNVHGLAMTDLGSPVVTGEFDDDITVGGSTITHSGFGTDLFVLRLDPNLAPVWDFVVGGPSLQYGEWIDATPDRIAVAARYRGTFNVAGNDHMGDGSLDGAVLALNNDGVPAWTTAFRGPGDDEQRSVAFSGDRLFTAMLFRDQLDLPGANTLTSAGDADGLVVALDSGGALLWHQVLGTPAYDVAWGVVERGGRVFVAGETSGALTLGGVTLQHEDGSDVFAAAFVR